MYAAGHGLRGWQLFAQAMLGTLLLQLTLAILLAVFIGTPLCLHDSLLKLLRFVRKQVRSNRFSCSDCSSGYYKQNSKVNFEGTLSGSLAKLIRLILPHVQPVCGARSTLRT
jgi:hypothetical protein